MTYCLSVFSGATKQITEHQTFMRETLKSRPEKAEAYFKMHGNHRSHRAMHEF